MLCKFEPLTKVLPTRYRCVYCGQTTVETSHLARAIHQNCPATESTVNFPSSLNRGIQYLNATMKWEAAGRPTRTDEEVLKIVENACLKCYAFTGDQCLECGCGIYKPEDERTAIVGIKFNPARFNKPRMATEDCPLRCKSCEHSKWKHLYGRCECGKCAEFIDPRKPP